MGTSKVFFNVSGDRVFANENSASIVLRAIKHWGSPLDLNAVTEKNNSVMFSKEYLERFSWMCHHMGYEVVVR